MGVDSDRGDCMFGWECACMCLRECVSDEEDRNAASVVCPEEPRW